jgi:N utilization substance protein B
MSTAGARRRAREAALQMLYQIDLTGIDADNAIKLYWATLSEDAAERAFAETLVRGCAEERDDIDAVIDGASQHWRLDRMARVDLNILRLATYELRAVAEVPRNVTLDEAIELAKRFGDENSPSFVNGVLDRIAHDLNKP